MTTAHDKRLAQAKASYAHHRIYQESEGRWLLRAFRNGSWEHAGYTEVISLYGGQLFVGGDYDPVVFAYYSGKDHQSKVEWLGRKHLDHYVLEKAAIGSGREAVTTFDAKEAAEYLSASLTEFVAAGSVDEDYSELTEAIDHYIHSLDDYRHTEASAMIKLHADLNTVEHGDSFLDDFSFPAACDTRLYHAHAALQRLTALFDERAAGNVIPFGVPTL